MGLKLVLLGVSEVVHYYQSQQGLWKILHINSKDRRTSVSGLAQANITSIEARFIQHQVYWTGHVIRMPDYLYSQLNNHCSRDR